MGWAARPSPAVVVRPLRADHSIPTSQLVLGLDR
jgi:hypothetical protein